MAQTTASLLVVPEVYGDMAQAEFLGKVKLVSSGAVLHDNKLEGVPGATVHFPKWNALGELDDLTETVAMTPVVMGTDDSTATIKEAGKAVEITDKARLVGLGDPLTEARRQFALLAARKVDANLITQAQADETAQGGTTPLAVTLGSGLTTATWSAITEGIKLFGDDWEPEEFAGIYVNSAQHVQLLNDPNFISADKFGASVIPRGQVGRIAGVDVFTTDRVAVKKILLIKTNALGLLYKRRPLVEQDRDILARSDMLTTTVHYAVKRLDDRAVGVVTLAAT